MSPSPEDRARSAAYGGAAWHARTAALSDEIGSLWAACGVANEWGALRTVLMHPPGPELAAVDDPDAALMFERPDPARAAAQHDALCAAYRAEGVEVVAVEPRLARPNQMFCADLFAMTPGGAIVGRPASTVRAGEEVEVARRLADMGVPILRTVGGTGTFEGADLMWLDAETALLGRGFRTNAEGVAQVGSTLAELGVDAIVVDLPSATMHLMEDVRIVDRHLAFGRTGLTTWTAREALRSRGYAVRWFPDGPETAGGLAHNVVTLGPRRVVTPAGNPNTRAALEDAGVTCVEVEVDELHRCAGGIGCLTGVVRRG